jgi:hypothetical protein
MVFCFDQNVVVKTVLSSMHDPVNHKWQASVAGYCISFLFARVLTLRYEGNAGGWMDNQ